MGADSESYDPEDKIRQIVRMALSKGKNLDDIRQKLSSTNIDKKIIDNVLNEFSDEPNNDNPQAIPNEKENNDNGDFDPEDQLKRIIEAAFSKGLSMGEIKKKLYATKIGEKTIKKVLDEYMKPNKKEISPEKIEKMKAEREKREAQEKDESNEKEGEDKEESGTKKDDGSGTEDKKTDNEDKEEKKSGSSFFGKIFGKKKNEEKGNQEKADDNKGQSEQEDGSESNDNQDNTKDDSKEKDDKDDEKMEDDKPKKDGSKEGDDKAEVDKKKSSGKEESSETDKDDTKADEKKEDDESKEKESGKNDGGENKDYKDSGKEGEEEEAFSPEEFEKLESKENKSLMGKFFKKKKDDDGDEKKDDDNSFEMLDQKEMSKTINNVKKTAEQNSIDITKVSGKIEVLTEKNEEMGEQIQNTLEKIGELRSTVLGRERMFNKLEDDFNSVKYTVNNFAPENLDKRFNEVNSQMLKHDSALDKIDARMNKQEDKINHYLKIMESISNFDNVIEQLKKLQKAEDHIKKLEGDVEKAASKIEIMLQNTSESVSKINKAHTKATNNEDAIKDIMNTLGKLEQKTEFFVKKEDFDNIKDDMKVIKKALFQRDYK